ncbi:signal recognition particle subunit [Saccharomycopsis crataegensis]|uniref:Signal recognition particle subunit SRP68 n=1 Tax=Saccharomycopsis crataegensis TaxID=43959 RepID=A0AAV5QGG6_9ASCO|nr:signal recognition particle subunit [Saccharomycopsis crataegensis]
MTSILGLTYGERSSLSSGPEFLQHSVKAKKRVAKLKKDLGIQVKDTKHYQDHDKTQEIDSEQYDSDDRYGLILLYLAERDLSKALEILVVSEVSSSRSKEKFIISKLKRTVEHIKQLIMISFNEPNKSKKIELYVYLGLAEGLLAVKQKKWSVAAYSLSVARNALEFLESYTDYQENKANHLYREIIESRIDPSLRLAITHSSFAQNVIDLNIVSKIVIQKSSKDSQDDVYEDAIELIKEKDESFLEVDESQASTRQLITEVTWSSYTAKLHSSEIARMIMEVQSSEKKIQNSDISSFDPVLIGWKETLESHEVDTERANSMGVEDEEEIRDRQIVLTFIKYHMHFAQVRRDHALIDSLNAKKLKNDSLVDINRDIVRIYEMILSTISKIQDLPGVYSDQDLSSDIEALKTYYQSLKYQVIANVYEIVKKHKESLLILENISQKLSGLKPLNIEKFPGEILSNEKLVSYTKQVSEYKVKVHVLAQFEHESSRNQAVVQSVADAVNIPVSINTIQELTNTNKLMDIESVKPVTVKPVFFDLAFNYVGETDQSAQHRLAQKKIGETDAVPVPDSITTSTTEKPKKKGLFGLWG